MIDPATPTPLRIAVVLCTYNGERFLAEQLRSLLAQHRRPDQLVIVDDASSDRSWTMLEAFRDEAERAGIEVVLQRNPANLGYVRNFESALALARADLLFLCDQDDVWHPGKIGRMEREFQQRPGLCLLHTDARLVDDGGHDLGCGLFEALEVTGAELASLHANAGFSVLLRRNVVTGATAAFRSELLQRARPFPLEWVHDEWLAVVCAVADEIDCLEDKLIDYRQHPGNEIGVRRRSAMEKFSTQGSRREHMRSVVARLETLQGYLGRVDMRVDYRDDLTQRLQHARARAGLPPAWPARLRWVLAEVRSGRYSRYSFGLRSIVADVLGLD